MDRDRGLRVDRLLEQLNATVAAHDLAGLRDLWSHLDSYIFNKLENHFAPGQSVYNTNYKPIDSSVKFSHNLKRRLIISSLR